MKELSRRFAANEHPSSQAITLRLMPHPIDRYSDPAAGQLDGTIFAFANGTNPEVMVLIEAQGPTPEKASWHFAIARITAASFQVTLDRRVVLTAPYHSGNNPSGCYFTERLPRTKP